MAKLDLVCWKCGAALNELQQPLARLEECPACHGDLHVCRMCALYATGVAKSCRETIAEEVKEKERANFCDYFQARPAAYSSPDDSAAKQAKSEIEALFGLESGGDDKLSSAEKARQELDELFGQDTNKDT